MTVAAPPRPTTTATPTYQLLCQLETELNASFLERNEAIRALIITLLAGENGFILGPPGTAKSELLEALCRAILGAKYFRTLMDKQMGKEDLGGAIDVPDYIANGHWGRDVTDTLMDAHVALLDEAGNTGPMVMNMLLTALNEGRNKPNGVWQDIPLISAFGASNYWLEDMPAAWDRFLVRFEVDDLQEDASFETFYARQCGTVARPTISTLINLADLQHAIGVEVPKVIIPAGVQDAVRQLRTDLRGESIIPSTRRLGKTAKLIKASAYLNGRTVADEDDLQVLQHVLWENVADKLTVKRKVLALTSPITRTALELAAQLDSISAEVDARRGQNTSMEDRAAYGGTAQFELNEVQSKLTKTLEQANREQRSTVALDQVADQVKSVRTKIYIECMNVTPERAARMA